VSTTPSYRLGHTYRDTASLRESDQLMRWINIKGSGIRGTGGVRPLKYVHLRPPNRWLPAYILLFTTESSRGSEANPWEDYVDTRHGRVVYWGDAKFHPTKTYQDWDGNKRLAAADEQTVAGSRLLVPPILHFSRVASGVIRFNGLCALERLELAWFEDSLGRPVRNYRAHLAILDEEFVELDWLHRRARAMSFDELSDGPPTWRKYQRGIVNRLAVHAASIRTRDNQLPPKESADARVLDELHRMHPTEFEAAIVTLFRSLRDVPHSITRTEPTGDGGFDFFGNFAFPRPVPYEVSFRGEVKRYRRTNPVRPEDVSRLVARLGRGQYGLFVTTSFFTRQAQEEVLVDGYPAALIAGADLVRMIRELQLVTAGALSLAWTAAVAAEYPGRWHSGSEHLGESLRAVAEEGRPLPDVDADKDEPRDRD
jgi:hypothetical protein